MVLLGSLASTHAQGTMQFIANLSGDSGYTGIGLFSLVTNYFSYDVQMPFGYSPTEIRSPWPDTSAPVVFNLQLTSVIQPEPLPSTNRGAYFFHGHFPLSDPQITELTSGQWFLSSYDLQGQILNIPEPGGVTLLGTGIGIFYFHGLRKFRDHVGANGCGRELNRRMPSAR